MSERTPEITNQVFAVQRSGHHAVMQWLQDGYETTGQTTTHQNDAYHGHLGESYAHITDPTVAEVLGKVTTGVLFVNYEDVPYTRRSTVPLYAELERTCPAQDVVVVRDWFGMLASRINSIAKAQRQNKPLQLHEMPWDQLARVWQDHAAAAANGETLAVRYNDWFRSGAYRTEVAEQFGVPNVERSLDIVPEFGDGSSFSGQSFDGRARSMNVLRRWDDLPLMWLDTFLDVATSYTAAEELNRELFGFGSVEVVRNVARRVGGMCTNVAAEQLSAATS